MWNCPECGWEGNDPYDGGDQWNCERTFCPECGYDFAEDWHGPALDDAETEQ